MRNYLKHAGFAVLIFVFSRINCDAQIKSAMVGVNGLTCSACSRTVEMSIRKLAFVKEVEMNLEQTEGKIYFVDNADVNMDKIAKAVKDAGFSVRYLSAVVLFSNLKVNSGFCFDAGKYNLQFINVTNRVLNGDVEIKYLGPQYETKSEYNKVKLLLVNSCANKNEILYFVTL